MCEPLINADEAAKILGIHEKTVRQMARAGELPGMKLGREWKFRASALDRWINSALQSSSRRGPSESEGLQ